MSTITTITGVPDGTLIAAGDHEMFLIERGSGYPTVFLHGGGPGCSGWTDFGPVVPFLSDRRMLIFDMLQYGQSSKPGNVGPIWTFNAKHLALALDSLGDRPGRLRVQEPPGKAQGGRAHAADEGPTFDKARVTMAELEWYDASELRWRLGAQRVPNCGTNDQRCSGAPTSTPPPPNSWRSATTSARRPRRADHRPAKPSVDVQPTPTKGQPNDRQRRHHGSELGHRAPHTATLRRSRVECHRDSQQQRAGITTGGDARRGRHPRNHRRLRRSRPPGHPMTRCPRSSTEQYPMC